MVLREDQARFFVFATPLGHGYLCGDASTLMKDVSEHVVSDIGDANFHLGSVDSYRPDEELHLVLLPGKDMLNGGPDF